MLAEALAVIRDRHHQQRVRRCCAHQSRMSQETSQLAVGERDLAVVRTVGESRRPWSRRGVGRVRVEQVHPEEERRVTVDAVEPT